MEAIEKLDGFKAGEKHLAVRFAKNVNYVSFYLLQNYYI